jgi:hypothetical protein
MRFVGYVKSGGRDPQDRMMGVVIDGTVAPLATVDAFYEDLTGWRQRASGLSAGKIPLADLTLAPPVPRDAKIVCAAINYAGTARSENPDANVPKPVRAIKSGLIVDGAHIPVPVAEPDGPTGPTGRHRGRHDIDADERRLQKACPMPCQRCQRSAAQLRSTTLSTGQWALKECRQSCPSVPFINGGCHFPLNLKRDHRDGHVMQQAPRRTWCSAFRSSSPSRPVT